MLILYRAKDTITQAKWQSAEWGKSLINYASVKRLISIIKNRKTEHQENNPIKIWNTELSRVLMRGNTNDVLDAFKVSNIVSRQGMKMNH